MPGQKRTFLLCQPGRHFYFALTPLGTLLTNLRCSRYISIRANTRFCFALPHRGFRKLEITGVFQIMILNFRRFCQFTSAAILAVATASAQTVIPLTSAGNTGAAPNGIAANSTELLYTQPYCSGNQTRGIYKMNLPLGSGTPYDSTLLNTLPETGACSENYLAVSTGLDGFTAGSTYATGSSTTNSANEAVYRNGSLFIDNLPASAHHAGVTFDTTGTFVFNLIVTLETSVRVYNSAGALVASYPVPTTLGPYVLEGATVAPFRASHALPAFVAC